MKTLESQLAEYCEFQDDLHPPIRVDEIDAISEPLTVDGVLHVPVGEAPVRPLPSRQGRQRSWRGWLVAAAAAAAVLVLFGGFGLLTRIADNTDAPPVVDQVEPEESQIVDRVEPEEPPVVEQEEPVPAPSTTLLPDAVEPSAPITGMAWRQVTPEGIAPTSDTGTTAMVSGGDRFLYVNVPNSTVGTSFDGINWTRESIQGSLDRSIGNFGGWRDTVVGFGCGGWVQFDGAPMTAQPGCVSVIHADGTVATQSFDAQINAAGIGPNGLVVIVTDSYDEDGLEYLAENDLATGLTGRDWEDFDGSVIEVVDGVLHIEFRDGQVSDYVLADHGYTAESQVASGWFSQDGDEWIPIPGFPVATNVDGTDWDVIGTRDGFVAISDDRNGGQVAWHSSNGLDWRELGPSSGGGWALNSWLSPLSRWSDGAIVVGAESVWYLSGGGIAEMPLVTNGLDELLAFASDNVGVVIVEVMGETPEMNQVLYSSDGQAWTNTSVPPQMLEDLSNLGMGWYQPSPVEVVAADNAVLLRLSVSKDDGDISAVAWYLGTPTRG
jgi:hypothetical protein